MRFSKSPTRDHAKRAIATFETKYGAKYPKAVHCLTKDTDALLAFYDFPADHWVHLRTSNPIESTFLMVRHRTIKVKGAFSNESALSMLYQLGVEAEKSCFRYCNKNPPKTTQNTFRYQGHTLALR